MSYRNNWLKHSLASVSGRGFNRELARDFWTSKEDLWDPKQNVSCRRWKFLFVYSMSAVAQITVPYTVIGVPIILFMNQAWQWLPIAVGAGTAIGLLGAMVATLNAHLSVSQKRR